jgi:hypothetical protein
MQTRTTRRAQCLVGLAAATASAALITTAISTPANAADHATVGRIHDITPMYDKGVRPHITPATTKAAAPSIKLFHKTVTDGARTFPYTMVGKSPFNAQADPVTTVSTAIVPIKIVLSNGHTYDPTVADSCAPSSSITRTLASPLFATKKYTWGGTVVGTGQFVSIFRRAEFWPQTKPTGVNPGYQVTLAPTTLSAITVNVPAGIGAEGTLSCGTFAGIEINWWDNYVRNTLMPQLATQGVGSDDFVLFELSNVVEYITTTANCCVLGYHNAFTNPADGGVTTYGTAMFDNSHGAFDGADISVLTHEIAEWMDDPLVDGVNNNTKPWGHIGQVLGCQDNLEVGDPLSGTLQTVSLGGVTWHPQELAFFSWFYHQNPSHGVNHWFSSHGTFLADADNCT